MITPKLPWLIVFSGLLISDVAHATPRFSSAQEILEIIRQKGNAITIDEQAADMETGLNFQGNWPLCRTAAEKITEATGINYTTTEVGNGPEACMAYEVRFKPGQETKTVNLVRCAGQPSNFYIREFRADLYIPHYVRADRTQAQ